ncbi:hypothetical protein AYM40_10510 [Paraburkholderia phytofirmans OLGA172]|uniref:Uncharacterized protein n=1 Tax=Paraburkholderia phytofirmans OLGA172 TaxID=1417228 RepID=A0A160FK69_9BURK|nr:hypothetical protein [Paraburkholderia phytofirmans]ANB72745.1 hypothetical protein AYM40_10510 [Paraburkholderia phytofirmans OLGA172]
MLNARLTVYIQQFEEKGGSDRTEREISEGFFNVVEWPQVFAIGNRCCVVDFWRGLPGYRDE